MARRISAATLLVALCAAGCSRSYRAEGVSLAPVPARDARAAMMDRLAAEKPPALKAVEIWSNPYGPGLKLVTDHYEIHTTLLEPLMLRTVPGVVEAAYRAYNDQLPQPIRTVNKFKTYLFADRQQWEAFTHRFAGEQAPILCRIKSGAYYLNGACVVYDIGRARTLSVLGHEGWHQFTNRHFKYRLPSWLDEGIAMQFESSVTQNGLFTFEPSGNRVRLGALSETLTKARTIPLRELIATSPGEVLASDQAEAVMAFYSQSYALVRFLREAGQGRRLPRYQRLLWDGLSGTWPLTASASRTAADRNLPRTIDWNRTVGPELFGRYFTADLDQLEREYLAFCRRVARETTVAKDPGSEYPALNR
ncbi:MAG: hypothetical protein JW993_09250 [Sedimentisphaerales bacterium]|nr:hypothetical protein [Sedimentisphaerales bacterium]